ncbi:MAG: FtsX-like permease family protein [Alphaproteobacteria bacterium]|jgi:putative ABC transport system permease protein|nr:FtsX-like permease family protein [Alphaproteobacteria bacterium]
MNEWSVARRFAARELRAGVRGFRVLIACLALGVASVAGVGSLASALTAGLKSEGRILLGGDVDLTFTHRRASAEQLDWLRANTMAISTIVEMRTMARHTDTNRQRLVELKAVDSRYPLYGGLKLRDDAVLNEALAQSGKAWGAAVDPRVLEHLGLKFGDLFRIGDVELQVAAVIEREPDRGTRAFRLGPRVITSGGALAATGLEQPGSLIRYHYRLALPLETKLADWRARLQERFPGAGWRIRDVENAAPGIQRFVDRVALFLSLIGLTALLVGGVGVANSVGSFMDSRITSIATLKCLGASRGTIFRIYFLQVAAMASVGIFLGLLIGAFTPMMVSPLLEGRLPVTVQFGFHAIPLLTAGAFGFLVAAVFTVWPLGLAGEVRAAALFRSTSERLSGRPSRRVYVAMVILAALIAVLAIATAVRPQMAAGYIVGSLLVFGIFRLAGALIVRGLRRLPRPRQPLLRLALANLYRPGAPTTGALLSLGLGLTVLVAVALLEHNLKHQIEQVLPEEAPGYYFIDIQPNQAEAFQKLVQGHPGVGVVQRVPMLRGRIVALAGQAVEEITPPPDFAWILRGDRGLTWSVQPPDAGSRITAGEWWPADYSGPPLVSFDARAAKAFGLGVGDNLTVNVLGKTLSARIANLRVIDWTSLGINFVMVFSPGLLEGAPQSQIATVQIDADQELALERAVADGFPNVTAIRVKEVLEDVNLVLANLGVAVRGIAAVAILAGILVLGGSIAADHRRRVYDAVVLKVVGATRRRILVAFLAEAGMLGLLASALAGLLGTVVAWAVVEKVMKMRWDFAVEPVLWTLILALAITMLLGFAGTWRALSQKAAPLLRND